MFKTKFIICLLAVSMVLGLLSSSVGAQGTSTTESSDSVSANEGKQTYNVESFIIETFSDTPNAEGFYERTGYKKVNAISEVIQQGNKMTSKVSKVEDYYDLNDNFVNTLISYEEFDNDLTTGKAVELKGKRNASHPATKHVTNKTQFSMLEAMKTEEPETFTLIELNSIEKAEVESNIKALVETVNKGTPKETYGMNQEDFDKISTFKQAQQDEPRFTIMSAAGAFDNYYNINLSTTNFTVQALSTVGHKYIRFTGKTLGSTKNTNGFNKFQAHINGYERNLVAYMEAKKWPEALGYVTGLAGLVTLVGGYAAGPPGWIAIVSYYGGALLTFAGLTSTIYATTARLELSRTAASYQQNARIMLINAGSHFENVTYSLVSGY